MSVWQAVALVVSATTAIGCGAPQEPGPRTAPVAAPAAATSRAPVPVLGPVRIADVVRGGAIGGIEKGAPMDRYPVLARAARTAGRTAGKECRTLGTNCFPGLAGNDDEAFELVLT